MTKLTDDRVAALTSLLQKNPLLNDYAIASECHVSRDTVRRYREKLGCMTRKRVSLVDGKTRVYSVKGNRDDFGKIDLKMLKQLAGLGDMPDGDVAFGMIKDLLKVIYETAEKETSETQESD